MYCASCEVRPEFICYVEDSTPPLWSSGQSFWLHNEDVLCFLWGTNWIYTCYVEESIPPLWSSGQSFWLQIQRPGFDFLRCQFFWEVVDLERGPLTLVSIIEVLLERKSSGFGQNWEYGCRDPSRWLRDAFYPQLCLQVAVAQSVYFARGLRPQSFFSFLEVFGSSAHGPNAHDVVCNYLWVMRPPQ
jgi:hypothetical protein